MRHTLRMVPATLLALVISVAGVSAGPNGFDHHADGTHTAKYKSDSSNDRCSQMAPKITNMANGYCTPFSMARTGPVWCDESGLCPLGICNHYAYLRFRCVGSLDAITTDESESLQRDIIILDLPE